MNEAPTKVYVGTRENVIREIGGLSHIYRGRYLAQFDGDAAWDAEGCDSLADMRDMIAEYQLIYPNLEVVWL